MILAAMGGGALKVCKTTALMSIEDGIEGIGTGISSEMYDFAHDVGQQDHVGAKVFGRRGTIETVVCAVVA